ncbi:MAG: MBG domain-containing protein, partial [Planctomycetota bacterium]
TSAAAAPAITAGTVQPGDTANFTETYDTKNAGTGKTLTPGGTVSDGNSGSNYTYGFAAGASGVITARALTVTAAGVNKVYDGTTAAAANLSSNQVAGDTLTLSYTSAGFNDKNVGNAKTVTVSGITVTGADSGNYASNTTAGTTAEITALAITVTAVTDSKTYDGSTSSAGVPAIASGSLAAGDTAGWTQTFDNKNVGTGKTLTPAGAVNDGNSGNNYSVTFAGVATGAITAKTLTVSGITAHNKVYDGTTAAALTGTPGTLAGVAGGDTVSLSGTAAGTFADKDVGNGKTVTVSGQSLTGTDAGNYTLTEPAPTADISALALTVNADAKSQVYGTANPALTYTYTGLANGDASAAFTGALATTATANPGVGTYAITQNTLAATGNYSIGTFNGANLSVTAASLTVTADAKSKVYGAANPALTYTYTGLANGDTSAAFTGALATTAAANSGVGTYAITLNTLVVTGNYSIGKFSGATLSVTAAPLTVTADAKSRVYGTANPALTYTYTGLVNGDKSAAFTGALATVATANSGVGTYAITQGTLAAKGSYGVNYVAAALTITQATATVTLSNPSPTYDGTPKTVVSSTTPAGLNLACTYDGSPVAPTNAGNYNVAATVNDPNYQGSAVGLLSIAPAAATVTLGSLTQTYDGTPKSATATTVPAGLQVTFTYNGSATPPTGAGSYAVVGTIADSNGSGSASGTLTIIALTPAATPTFSPAAGSYVGAQSVTISCATSGAKIFYTTDGSTPTASSLLYTAAINVSTPATIKAYAVQAGLGDSPVASATYTVYLPNSAGAGQPTPNLGVTAANPVDGTSVTVAASDGGVVQLNAGETGGALPPGGTITTVYYDAAGNVVATVQGPQSAYEFADAGMYLAVVTVTDAQGNTGTTEIALPISAAETGTAQGTTPPSSMTISAVTLKGKLLFTPGKADSVAFKGTVVLPAGLDLSKAQTLIVSLGNVVDTANLNTKGQVKAGARNRLKSVAVKYPKIPKVNKKVSTITTAGLKATVAFTLSAPQLDVLGFAAEGISKAGGTLNQSVSRTVQAALVLGGAAYRVDVPVNWKLSKKGDNGQLTSKK